MNHLYLMLANNFLDQLFEEINQKKIKLLSHDIDHLCFRTDSEADYLKVCQDFSGMGELLVESMVGGRLISTFKLKDPLIYHDFKIPLVEIPAPKKGSSYQRGFEHIEMVVNESFDELIEFYGGLKLDKRALDKKLNPDLVIILDSGAIKLHHQSLERVIEIEKAMPTS